MTAVRETVDLRAEHEEHTMKHQIIAVTGGEYVVLDNNVMVYVSYQEITRAIRNSRSTDTPARRATAARNIAIGKKAGAYEAEGV